MIPVGSCVLFFLYCCVDNFDDVADLAAQDLADVQEHVGGDAFSSPTHCRAFGEASWQAPNTRALPEDPALQQARALQGS